MRTSTRRGLQLALVVGGAIFCSAQAQADDTTGIDSILGGNQAVISVEAPVTAAGNAISVIGDSTTKDATATVQSPGEDSSDDGSDGSTSGEESVAGGNQVEVPVTAPVTVSGNAASVVGDSTSEDADTGAPSDTGDSESATATTTSGEESVAGGNQVQAPVTAPVAVGGNAVSVLGDSHSEGSMTGVSSGSGGSGTGDVSTSGGDSVAGGNQVIVPVTAPVAVGGNAVSVLGDSHSEGSTTPSTGGGSGTGDVSTSGGDSVAGGNQVIVPVTAPVTVGGNAVSVLGDSHSEGSMTGVSSGSGGAGTGDVSTSGGDSVAGGNQVIVPVTAPVAVGGNAVSVLGDSSTGGSTTTPGGAIPVDETDPTAPVDPTTPTDPTTPVDPTTPTSPTTPGDGSGIVDDVVLGASPGVVTATMVTAASVPATASMLARTGASTLAQTGAATGFLLAVALLLLGLGIALTALSRRGVTATA